MIKWLFNILLAGGLFICSHLTVAQDTLSHHPLKYYNNLSFGAFVGNDEKPVTASISTTHGLVFSRLRAGLGIGYDGYESWKMLPVFVSTSFDFIRLNGNSFYVQFNAGYSYAWRINRVEYSNSENEEGGLMLNPMVGYRINTDKYSLYLSFGSKIQKATYSYGYSWGSEYVQEQELKRFMLSMGLGIH